MSTDRNWYYKRDGRKLGPLTSAQLQAAAADGTVLPTDLLWREGMKGWAPANKLKGLTFGAAEKEQDMIDLLPPPDPKLMAMYQARHKPPVVAVDEVDEVQGGRGGGPASSFDRTRTAARELDYAGFWKRFIAAFVDWVFLFFIGIVCAVISFGVALATGAKGPNIIVGIIQLIGGSIQLWYVLASDNNPSQGSIGKRMMGIMVTDLDGHRMSSLQSIGRSLARLLVFFTFGLTLLICAFTPKKQSLHDMIAGTVVVNR